MEINKYSSSIAAYGVNAGVDVVKKDTVGINGASKNVDKADFSTILAKQRSVDNMKAEVKKAINSGASPERIESLKQMIARETYNVSAELVASAIFA